MSDEYDKTREQLNYVEFKGKKVRLVRQTLGPFNIKKEGRAVSNKSGVFMVVSSVNIRKVPGQNNRILIDLVMPKPDDIEVEVSQIGDVIEESRQMIADSKQAAGED